MTQFTEPLTLAQVVKLDLKKLNQRFDKLHPKDILAWCIENTSPNLVQTSAFSVDDLMITDLFYRALRPTRPVPVLFLDTLHHFPQTLEVVAKAKAIYNLNLKIYRTPGITSREAFAKQYGEAFWEKDLTRFHHLTKLEPLHKGLTELGAIAWITGRRRDQSFLHAEMPIFELDKHQRLKVNPLANWTRKETWAYVFEHDIIYNPLHDQGYSRIGDEPLTVPIQDGEDEQARHRRRINEAEYEIS